MKKVLLCCLLCASCDSHSLSNEVSQSWRQYITNDDIKKYLPYDDCPEEWLINEAVEHCHLNEKKRPLGVENSFLQAKELIRAKLARAQTFRNYMQRLLSDAVANAEYDSKAKSPDDSDGIDFAEFRAILGKQQFLSNMDNSQLLQFMEGNEENSFTDGLPDILKSQIETIARDYKDNTPNYSPNLQKVKLKVYLGTAAKPNLVSAEVQTESPSVRPKMQLQLSKSTAYGVPEVDTARADRFRAAIGNVFGTVLKNTSIVTDRNSLDPNAIIITTGDFALIKDSVSSAWAEVSSGSADDFMKKGSGQFAAIQMLDQYLKKIQPSITKKQNARKQLNLQRLSPSKGASNRGNPQQLTALDREIESLNGKIKALQAISARVKDIFHDFQTGKQSPSSIEIPQFVLVLDDQNSTTESAPPTEGQPAAGVVRPTGDRRQPLATLPQNVAGQTGNKNGQSNARLRAAQRESDQRRFELGLKPKYGEEARKEGSGNIVQTMADPHPDRLPR